MKVFAISDPHLSLTQGKSMDIFGQHWAGHWEKIKKSWEKCVAPEDAVVIAGDLSWAMSYEDALPDLNAICQQPGQKVLIRGNHDYWHGSLKKTRELLHNSTYLLQNDALRLGDYTFFGTRGWKQRGAEDFDAQDEKVFARELERLKLSLKAAQKLGGELVGVCHYPPFSQNHERSEFTDLYAQAGARKVIYGHLHGRYIRKEEYENIVIDGVEYLLTSCDYLGFQLRQIY